MNLQNILGNLINGKFIDAISKKTGVNSETIRKIISIGLPILIGFLAKNATNKTEAQKIDKTVEEKHSNGGLFEDITNILIGKQNNQDGVKIINHILGDNQTAINKIADKTGESKTNIINVLSFIAPLVMASLGKAKTQNNLNSDGMAKMLEEQTDKSGNPLIEYADKFLDKDNDGSFIDDIIDWFKK